jgi:nitronate monooxygenase
VNAYSMPTVIQGGMGVGVSNWRLARAVSAAGQLGVVSGTALDAILIRRLQFGDVGGHVRRALDRFPILGVAQRILGRYFVPGGLHDAERFKAKPIGSEKRSRHLEELLVAANFVEVFLAREGHTSPVGINYLEKIQLPTLPSIYGAMLAGVAYILMGAGIPRAIPGILDQLAEGRPVALRLDVQDALREEEFTARFEPDAFCGGEAPRLDRPRFIAIVSSATLANVLARKASGRVDGFVVEGPSAGGHNAPPRGRMPLSDAGSPVYGDRDVPDLEAIKALGLPFWLAGSYAEPGRVTRALELGAAGVQIGTAFAFCEESGLDPELKERILVMIREGEARVFTDPVASPTGFPFKVLQVTRTHSDAATYDDRTRVCDLGYLRHAYKKPDGTIGWRCPAEPIEDYVRKGGDEADTRGRKCVCNGLLANIGLGQIQRDGERERPLLTSGDDLSHITKLIKPGAHAYRAADVIEYLLGAVDAARGDDSGSAAS